MLNVWVLALLFVMPTPVMPAIVREPVAVPSLKVKAPAALSKVRVPAFSAWANVIAI
jgi:hypothetical protein